MFEQRDRVKDRVYKVSFNGKNIIFTKTPDYPPSLEEYDEGYYDIRLDNMTFSNGYVDDAIIPFISDLPAMLGTDNNQYILFPEGLIFSRVMLTDNFNVRTIYDVVLM